MNCLVTYLEFVFNAANFNWIFQIVLVFMFHIDGHRMKMMNFETLMWRGVLMIDFMVMIGFRLQWFRIMNDSGKR